MTASHCDFNGAFDVCLAFDLAEIDVIALMRGKKSGQIGARRKKRSFAAEKRECLSQILHAVDIDLIDHCGLERVCFRDNSARLPRRRASSTTGKTPFTGRIVPSR